MKKIIDLLKKEHYLQFIIYIFIFGLIAVGLFFLDKSIQNSNFVEVLKFSQDFHSDLFNDDDSGYHHYGYNNLFDYHGCIDPL